MDCLYPRAPRRTAVHELSTGWLAAPSLGGGPRPTLVKTKESSAARNCTVPPLGPRQLHAQHAHARTRTHIRTRTHTHTRVQGESERSVRTQFSGSVRDRRAPDARAIHPNGWDTSGRHVLNAGNSRVLHGVRIGPSVWAERDCSHRQCTPALGKVEAKVALRTEVKVEDSLWLGQRLRRRWSLVWILRSWHLCQLEFTDIACKIIKGDPHPSLARRPILTILMVCTL